MAGKPEHHPELKRKIIFQNLHFGGFHVNFQPVHQNQLTSNAQVQNHILEVDTEHAMKNRYFLKRMETLKGVKV